MPKITSLNDIAAVAAYLSRIGAEPRSLRTAVVRENYGNYWKDIATITILPDGTIKAPDAFAPTEGEADNIKKECATVEWPKPIRMKSLTHLPDAMKDETQDNMFIFKDEQDQIIMIQQRVSDKQGEKRYIPWTYWDDQVWRRMEPEGKLPLWGIDQLKDYSTVFIHEGAKAARRIAQMVEGATPEDRKAMADHPWGDELAAAAHVGWIGGALSPYRTDWGVLMRLGVKRVYIVSDNDPPGVAAVPSIAYHLRIPTFHVQFTQDWPASFDLADDFPAKMFKEIEGVPHYVGPSFKSCLHPSTWATDQIPNKKGKPTTILRDEFRRMWSYVETADMYVCNEMPEILRSQAVLDKMLSAFSHVTNTCTLISKSYAGRQTKLCYRPDVVGRTISDRDTSAINLHTPSHIKAADGNAQPWLDFMAYLFPNPEELKETLRWCATLIARPGTRMEYGLLLVSETQGVGKTTLGERVLAPLVGVHNTSFATEGQITNPNYNGWQAKKRLVVVGEIYSGHSWKAYNLLKSAITDRLIDVNEKYERQYKIENWVHIFACSNSRRALKVDKSDRRWYYPEVNEIKWPKSKFIQFHNWLQSGGLGIIKRWAEQYGDYVEHGDPAPMTLMKKALIEDSMSPAQRSLSDFCESVVEDKAELAVGIKSIVSWLEQEGKPVYDSDYELRKIAKERGFIQIKHRVRIGHTLQYVMVSPHLAERINGELSSPDKKVVNEAIRTFIKHPADVVQAPL